MQQQLKPILRAVLSSLAAAALAAGLLIWLLGGVEIGRLTARDPWRAIAVALICALAWMRVSGVDQIARDWHRHSARLVTLIAVILAISPALAGLARNSWTAGGADSYAYVSQADLWLHFRLKTAQPLAASAPWPDALWTLTPYGYRPAPDGVSLVPVTAPGLPLMMASAKAVAGHCAMFWVVPLTGAMLVWMTFVLGSQVGSSAIGLGAAWLLATSPVFLAMLVSPMSDVPASAFWALATYLALKDTPKSAIGCGLAMAAAILIRPNLAPLAGVIGVWKLMAAVDRQQRFVPVALMFVSVLPGGLVIAIVNRHLYGSALASGYGNLHALFSLGYVGRNLSQYGRWLIESQTPLALVGIATLVVPARAIWPGSTELRRRWLLAAMVGSVWALYCIYTPFDVWWYLRFLLPGWPGMCIGAAAVLVRLAADRRFVLRVAGIALLVGVGIHGIQFAAQRGAFPSGEGDHRYATIAKLTEQMTDARSVIITGQNAGPTRYYGARDTMRFDLLDPHWLDRAVGWLDEHQRHPYFLLEEWEVPVFQQRFGGASRLGTLPLAPVMAYRAPGVPGSVYLFDPLRADGPTLRPGIPASARRKCVEP